MKQRLNRWLAWLTIALGSGTLFQVTGFTNTNIPGGGCSSFYANGIATSVDFCYLLNCDNGFIGGLVQPCGDPNSAEDDLLVDCGAGIGTGGEDDQEEEQ